MNEVITLPWREFKAFVQIYDTRGSERPNIRHELLATSSKRAGAITREHLLKHGLIRVVEIEGDSIELSYERGVPLGRDYDMQSDSVVVAPRATSSPGSAWVSARGRCSYCGEELRFFKGLALGRSQVKTVEGTRTLLAFACKSCHAAKGARTIEEFRFVMAMKLFWQKHDVRFSRRQVAFLKQRGFDMDIPRYEFFFEQVDAGVNRWAEKWDDAGRETNEL